MIFCLFNIVQAFFKSDTRFFAKVHISSKVEFQPELGASKLSRSELLREYIDLRLRPGSVLLRGMCFVHWISLSKTVSFKIKKKYFVHECARGSK